MISPVAVLVRALVSPVQHEVRPLLDARFPVMVVAVVRRGTSVSAVPVPSVS